MGNDYDIAIFCFHPFYDLELGEEPDVWYLVSPDGRRYAKVTLGIEEIEVGIEEA